MFAIALRIIAAVLFLVAMVLVMVGGAAANLPEVFLFGGLASLSLSFLPLP